MMKIRESSIYSQVPLSRIRPSVSRGGGRLRGMHVGLRRIPSHPAVRRSGYGPAGALARARGRG